MAHFNFVISQNAKWGHAGFYIDCHRMMVPENILLQKSTGNTVACGSRRLPLVCSTDSRRVSDAVSSSDRRRSAESCHVTLLPVSLRVRGTAPSSSSCRGGEARRGSPGPRRGDARRAVALNTAATVLGRRESRPLPRARASIDSDRDCRPPPAAAAGSCDESDVAAALDCTLSTSLGAVTASAAYRRAGSS